MRVKLFACAFDNMFASLFLGPSQTIWLPSTYGDTFTRAAIAVSSVLAALAIGWASTLIGISAGYLRLIAVLTAGLLLLAFATFRVESDRVNLANSNTRRFTCCLP